MIINWLNWKSILETIVSGIALAVLFFFFREKVFPLPKLSGMWKFVTTTKKTSHKDYQDMELEFIALLWCEGEKIKGTVEKVSESINGNFVRYKSENRIHIELNGFINKKYFFSKDEAVVHLLEKGKKRDSSSEQTLVIKGENEMIGDFVSTVANSSGRVVWIKQTKEN